MAGIDAGTRVLDIGSGIGGPSRHLGQVRSAATSSAIDLTAEYCRVAEALTARTGLADKVTYKTADALNLPFEGGSFDVVWTQHVAMNIADRPRLYSEMHRVLKRGWPARALRRDRDRWPGADLSRALGARPVDQLPAE